MERRRAHAELARAEATEQDRREAQERHRIAILETRQREYEVKSHEIQDMKVHLTATVEANEQHEQRANFFENEIKELNTKILIAASEASIQQGRALIEECTIAELRERVRDTEAERDRLADIAQSKDHECEQLREQLREALRRSLGRDTTS